MPHVVLLGDSVFDNGAYTDGGPDVISQLRDALPAGWSATLAAVDGYRAHEIAAQMAGVPGDASHLALSVGGNDALAVAELLDQPVKSTADALRIFAAVAHAFEARYRAAVDACLTRGLPLIVCTIYHGNFPDADFTERVVVALTIFNDVILRTARDHSLDVVDLRAVCALPEDYANPIEPSPIGGAKIASALVAAVTGRGRGARLLSA